MDEEIDVEYNKNRVIMEIIKNSVIVEYCKSMPKIPLGVHQEITNGISELYIDFYVKEHTLPYMKESVKLVKELLMQHKMYLKLSRNIKLKDKIKARHINDKIFEHNIKNNTPIMCKITQSYSTSLDAVCAN
ncbi:TPA: hypothetical protein HA235_01380 [Candidatus Woesearchaeota archaeon]|nr:hypothetical protein [Candidatus Woesearchaeota archaeon]HIH31335.1 hypothetical protein [Candidatus Woesearchaeota archaeon]HIH55187.1 hypothetical protein [Candidatus Woesearchaeota archaeon]HIJ02036.1 hypothetical protein [Candidatus Woesearchaeota archaeon]HIJ13635.1 hypothetical protein [Candidatus Woesearchaeota archaeon]